MKPDKPGLCFLSSKLWLTWKNSELSFLGVGQTKAKNENSEFTSPDKEFGVFRKYQVIAISRG